MVALAYCLHLLAAIVWVGGMFFAHMVVRPSALELEGGCRLPLWQGLFRRFFRWVGAAVVVLPATGYLLIAAHGGMGAVGWPVHVMHLVGWLMILLFLTLLAGPYRRFRAALASGDTAAAARHQGGIRRIVATNLTLGLAISALVAAARWW